jgi:8-amino-3,8-dideoxy-alpha-D-manno-octulosonate transaminase
MKLHGHAASTEVQPSAHRANPHPPQPITNDYSRRDFLRCGVALLPLAGITPRVRAAEVAGDVVAPIDPGFVGPQFFDADERNALAEVIDSGSPFRYWGPGRPEKVRRFEESFAERMGCRYALGVTSGTAALDCAVAALGVGPGDEVIVPAYTWWSDYTCVIHAGALPVFADIDRSLNLDPADFARRITPRTKAVIVVHLLGGPADLEPILATAQQHGIRVIEDCAQCVGGSYRGAPLGSMGDIGIYSFQINKMITTGEGGALVTSDPKLYERAARFHDMGNLHSLFQQRLGGGVQEGHFPGENFRMSELTGAVAGAQLPKISAMVQQLREHAEAISDGIRSLPGLCLRHQPDPAGDIGSGVFFELSDRAARDRCIAALRQRYVPASTLTGSVLLPIQESVVEKRTRHSDWPSFTSSEGRAIQYGSDCCRQTLELFDRFVQIRVGAKYTARIDGYIAEQVRQVWPTLG